MTETQDMMDRIANAAADEIETEYFYFDERFSEVPLTPEEVHLHFIATGKIWKRQTLKAKP